MKYFYLRYELPSAKSKPPFAQPKICTPPNQNPFSPRTNDLLPSEITACEIKITQAKSIFPKTKIDFLAKIQLTFSEAKSVFAKDRLRLPLTKSKSLKQNPFSLNTN